MEEHPTWINTIPLKLSHLFGFSVSNRWSQRDSLACLRLDSRYSISLFDSRGRSGKIARPLRSRIAYYYNTRSSRRHQCISISRSIACEPTIVNFKKQNRFFGFWEAYKFFWQVYCNVRTHVASGPCSDVFVYGKSNYNVILHIPCHTQEENSD